MNKFKKTVSMLLALALAASITACSQTDGGNNGVVNNTASDQSSTTPEQSFAEAETRPVDEDAPTGTITWLMYEDLLSSKSDLVALFESRYGGSIEQIVTGSGNQYFETLGTYIATGDSPDIVRYEWRSFPHAMSYNMYTPLDSYIDLDSDLWKGVKDIAEQFVYNGKHYYVPYQLTTNYALNYNNRVLEENGIDDPMKMVQAGTWDWNAFEEICKQWKNIDPVNHISYNGVGGMIMVLTTGVKVIDIKDNQIINNLKNENISRCMQWIENLRKNGLLGATADQMQAGASNGYVDPGAAFIDGNLLFLGMNPSWAYGAAKESLDKAGLENEMKFIPYPKDPLSDKYYHGINTFGYLIPSGAPNVKGALDWIELNRVEETDETNMANARAEAIDDSLAYYPICANSGCGDTSENGDSKGRHIFTDEENKSGMTTCPVCGEARREKYKVVWSEEQYDLWMELKSMDGRFEMLFDNCYGFSDDVSNLFYGGDEPILDGPVFHDLSYTSLVESKYDVVEGYLNQYRDILAKNAAGEVVTSAAE